MKLKQLENLVTIDEDVTDDKFGTYYDKRSVEQLLNYGLILLDNLQAQPAIRLLHGQRRSLKSQRLVIVEH